MDTCGDNRFEIIEKAKQDLLESTNISSSEEEMKVLDNFLFRCWQMGWLDNYNNEQVNTRIKIDNEHPLPEFEEVLGYNKEWIEADLKNGNVSPILYGVIPSNKRGKILKELEQLYNNLGIDNELSTPDYLLAEYTLNCLIAYGNAMNKNKEKGYIKLTFED